MLSPRKIQGIMSTPVLSVRPEVPVIEALSFAQDHHIHHIPVLFRHGPVGLLCTCDLGDLQLAAPVGPSVHTPAATIPSSASCLTAAQLMDVDGVESLLVTDRDRVVGIVTRRDLARAGLPGSILQRWQCVYCGSLEHVHEVGGVGSVCADCRERLEPPLPDDELGAGD